MGKRFDPKRLEAILSLARNDEERLLILESDDPVLWAERHFFDPDTGKNKFRAKPMFYDLLRSPKRDRAVRVGRQIGKTVHMSVDILHTLAFERNSVVLIFVPDKKLMNRILDIMGNMLRNSDLAPSYMMSKATVTDGTIQSRFDYQITCSSGSVARFFFMGNNPNKARGQRGTHIYIDEAEYLSDKAYVVITGILNSNPGIRLWASSTPTGVEGSWFRNFCEACASGQNEHGEEFYLPSRLDENWPELEKRLRSVIFDEVQWELEVEARWATPKGAVYRSDIIDKAIERSKINGRYPTSAEIFATLSYLESKKFLGVDWNNPQNGVRIVEIAEIEGNPWVVRNERIAFEEYTQTRAIERIIELHSRNRYRCISVDAGYGETQIELLFKSLKNIGDDPTEIVNIVDSNKTEKMNISLEDIKGFGESYEISVKAKSNLVNLLGKYLEENLVILYEHTVRNGLVSELRNFKRKSTKTGSFVYSENSHSLSALQICINGYDKYRRSEGKVRQQPAMVSSSSINEIANLAAHRKDLFKPAILNVAFVRRDGNSHRTKGLYGSTRRTVL